MIDIDVGGTKIAAGLVDPSTGALSNRHEIPTLAGRGGQAVLDDVVELATSLRDGARAAGYDCPALGLGICELVDAQGNVRSAQTVAWDRLPVQEIFNRVAPAVVEADVRAHALAEAYFGAGRQFNLFAFITVGTGISSTLVQAKQAMPGARGNALVLASAPLIVPCGENGEIVEFILEEYASGPALLARYNAATGTALVHGRELVERAAAGDVPAQEILRTAGQALGNSLAFLANITDPEAIVVGGGLGVAGGLYWESMIHACRSAIYAEETRDLPIVQAELGADAGIIGAALSALKKTEIEPFRVNV
jgi:glucokinase